MLYLLLATATVLTPKIGLDVYYYRLSNGILQNNRTDIMSRGWVEQLPNGVSVSKSMLEHEVNNIIELGQSDNYYYMSRLLLWVWDDNFAVRYVGIRSLELNKKIKYNGSYRAGNKECISHRILFSFRCLTRSRGISDLSGGDRIVESRTGGKSHQAKKH
jgi:hypothetical protein